MIMPFLGELPTASIIQWEDNGISGSEDASLTNAITTIASGSGSATITSASS